MCYSGTRKHKDILYIVYVSPASAKTETSRKSWFGSRDAESRRRIPGHDPAKSAGSIRQVSRFLREIYVSLQKGRIRVYVYIHTPIQISISNLPPSTIYYFTKTSRDIGIEYLNELYTNRRRAPSSSRILFTEIFARVGMFYSYIITPAAPLCFSISARVYIQDRISGPIKTLATTSSLIRAVR